MADLPVDAESDHLLRYDDSTSSIVPNASLWELPLTWLMPQSVTMNNVKWLNPGHTFPHPQHLLTYIHHLLLFLVPSFLNGLIPGTKRSRTPKTTLHPTSALDGLRGFASCGVAWVHFAVTFNNTHDWGFGSRPTDHYFFQLPFINFFIRGTALVACFFLISGYVLSVKPLKQIRSRSDASLLRTMGSSTFRRGIRLYIPTLSATFISMLLVWAGAFERGHANWNDGYSIFQVESPPNQLESFNAQFANWWESVSPLVNIFYVGEPPFYVSPIYDPHLWTIPIEFKGSMMLFVFTVGISGLRTSVRVLLEIAFISYCVHYEQVDTVFFFLGLFMAEIHLILEARAERHSQSQHPSSTDTEKASPTTPHWTPRSAILYILAFAAGLYLGGTPFIDACTTPGYRLLCTANSSARFWQGVGCILLVWTARYSPDVQLLFCNPFAQYLGKISYALYIVHGNVRRSLTFAAMPTIWRIAGGKDTYTSYTCAVLMTALLTGAVTVWLADVFWRAVDAPSVKFSRLIEGQLAREKELDGNQGAVHLGLLGTVRSEDSDRILR